MKLTATSLLVFILITCISCSKEKHNKPTLADKLKNTVWTGEMRYVGRGINEPFSFYFDDQDKTEWDQLDGTSSGTYTVDEATRSVQVSFASGGSLTAKVTEDNKLEGFQTGGWTSDWSFLTGELYTIQEKELTGTWTGGPGSSSIKFKGPATLEQVGVPQEYIYSRRHGTIRFGYIPTYHFFGIVKGVSIKGINTITSGSGIGYRQWEVNHY